MPFEEWWDIVITILDFGKKVRNWTPHNGFTVGGEFIARSYRSLTQEQKINWNNGYPFSEPSDWLVCTQLKGEGATTVSKKEFQDRYNSWRSYRDNKIIRKDFDGKTKASPYLISIFHEFDKLIG